MCWVSHKTADPAGGITNRYLSEPAFQGLARGEFTCFVYDSNASSPLALSLKVGLLLSRQCLDYLGADAYLEAVESPLDSALGCFQDGRGIERSALDAELCERD